MFLNKGKVGFLFLYPGFKKKKKLIDLFGKIRSQLPHMESLLGHAGSLVAMQGLSSGGVRTL